MSKKKVTVLSVLLEILVVLKELGKAKIIVAVESVAERFITLKDGWTRDTQTGLEWSSSSDKLMKLEEAKKFCIDQGGRLPNVTELFSLVDRTKHNPATLIPGMKSEWYWTCEVVAWYPSFAWCVSFSYGLVTTYTKDGNSCVRPVRSSK